MTGLRTSSVNRLRKDRRGSAAVEMALVTPMLLALVCGAADLGNYFLSEHAVLNGVRDGARYASRMYATNCVAVTNDTGTVATATKYIVRTNSVDGTGGPRLNGWTDNATVTVSVACNTTTGLPS